MLHAANAGRGVKNLAKYGQAPNLPSGHYQRHLQQKLPLYKDAEPAYEIELPVHGEEELGREVM
eukprot:6629483-Karenia_brevis.AAC.1